MPLAPNSRPSLNRTAIFFQAIGEFLHAGHRLTILTGNCYIELTLPAVRRKLREAIGVQPGHDLERGCWYLNWVKIDLTDHGI